MCYTKIELKPCTCSTEEQETIIRIGRGETEAHVWTSDNTRITKMEKLLNTPGTLWKLVKTSYTKEGDPAGYEFVCSDKRLVGIRAKHQETKPITEEEKAVLVARLKEARNKQTS